MMEKQLHFKNDRDFNAFEQTLRPAFPSRCTDSLGNTCHEVEGATLDITEQVDLAEISEDDAKTEVRRRAGRLAIECKYGFVNQQCTIGQLCAHGLPN